MPWSIGPVEASQLVGAKMSAASTTTPAIVRSSSRRQSSYNAPSTDRPQRIASTRQPSSQTPPSHSDSQPQSGTRPLSSSQQASLAGVARRDYETTNVARPPSNRRSSSRDRSYTAPPPKRTESTRDTRRTPARPGSRSRNSPQMDTKAVAAAVGPQSATQAPTGARATIDPASQASGSTTTRKRTEIDAQTGKWSLGKTIGAGSMGKVKLAKNLETGEQVCFIYRRFHAWIQSLMGPPFISVQ